MLLYPMAEVSATIRKRNRFAVLNLLRLHGILSKSELARRAELTAPTITNILDTLTEEGLVRGVDETDGNRPVDVQRGRPSSLYTLNIEGCVTIGLQITSNMITAILMRLDGVVLQSGQVSASWTATPTPNEVLALAVDLVERLLPTGGAGGQRILGIGIALEGIVDTVRGDSVSMPYRTGWNQVAVAQYFADRFGVPVLIDWRVYAATLAEAYYGAARGSVDFTYLNVDTGIAIASVSSGILMRSLSALAGSSGNLSHLSLNGGNRLCFCGNTGCIQTEISIPALMVQLEEMTRLSQSHGLAPFWQDHELTLVNLNLAAETGDMVALQLRHRLAHNLITVIQSVIQLYSSNLVVIGGPVIQFGGNDAIDAARQAVQRLALLHPLFATTQVVASTLQPDSATVGAATLIVQAVMDGRLPTPEIAVL